MHFRALDWKFAGLTASVAGILVGGAADAMGSFTHVMKHCAGLGGTEFLMKTPLLDTVLTLSSKGHALPGDFNNYGPPGPGCRCALFLFRPRGQTRHTCARDHAYSNAYCAEGQEFRQELVEFHGEFLRAHGWAHGSGNILLARHSEHERRYGTTSSKDYSWPQRVSTGASS